MATFLNEQIYLDDKPNLGINSPENMQFNQKEIIEKLVIHRENDNLFHTRDTLWDF